MRSTTDLKTCVVKHRVFLCVRRFIRYLIEKNKTGAKGCTHEGAKPLETCVITIVGENVLLRQVRGIEK